MWRVEIYYGDTIKWLSLIDESGAVLVFSSYRSASLVVAALDRCMCRISNGENK